MDETPHTRRRSATAGQKLLTPQQAETLTGWPYTTIRDQHFRGNLPVVKLPGSRRWWIRREDLDALIERSLEKVPA